MGNNNIDSLVSTKMDNNPREVKKKCTKWCFVPMCQNTELKNPDKVFITVPKSDELRRQWFRAAHREFLGSKSSFYCCEDHFDVSKQLFIRIITFIIVYMLPIFIDKMYGIHIDK